MEYEPFIAYETLHNIMLAFLMTCFAIPVGGLLYSWIVRLTKLDSDKITTPDWNFSPERDEIRIVQIGEQTPGMPYYWAKVID